jgi:hypothetical protein
MSEGEKICHIVESGNPDRALSGKDVTGLSLELALADVRRPRRALRTPPRLVACMRRPGKRTIRRTRLAWGKSSVVRRRSAEARCAI